MKEEAKKKYKGLLKLKHTRSKQKQLISLQGLNVMATKLVVTFLSDWSPSLR